MPQKAKLAENLGIEKISQTPEYAYKYALHIIKGRFELGENAISTSAQYSFSYAMDVLKRNKFKLGEEAISKDGEYSYYYALYIIKGKFELGENAINESGWKKLYTKNILEPIRIIEEERLTGLKRKAKNSILELDINE